MENLIKQNWAAVDIDELDRILKVYSEPEFKKFTEKIVNSPSPLLGVRSPVMRNIVKAIAKGNIVSFLDNVVVDNCEKAMIYGLLVTKIKNESTAIEYFNKFLKFIDNWAVCDTVCLDFCLIGKHKEKYWNFVSALLNSSDEFVVRAGIILLLKFYRTEEFMPKVFNLLDNISSDAYYINMAQAWLISAYFIEDREKTFQYLKDNKLNNFTHNKAIQKIRESFRVSDADKEELKLLKRI